MTLSSIVIQTKQESFSEIKTILKESDICEYHMDDNNAKIIVTIEGENTGDEINKLRELQNISGIISANMVYSYSEDELDLLRDNIDDTNPDWLNDPNADASKIDYKGDLKKSAL